MGAGTSPAGGTHADGPAEETGTAEEARVSKVQVSGETGVPGEAVRGETGTAGEEEAPGTADADGTSGEVASGESGSTWAPSRRFSLTRDTARPEGGGRAASGDAPAPARQWPLLTVLCTAGLGLLIVAIDPFAEAFRVGTMVMGVALLAGAVLRWTVPSVGMLAVRSRFTDLVTYGLMGALIVLLALMEQPGPWLRVPFLQDVVHFTIR
ncbi:DUF3017 domain-containing protein [Streptomyces sp. QL37]|uniref:DUF3017 domain-containing protein n=1 Tax=Streptomyces sp. QL37 TaxID=2093747 RepID=UPI000CF2402F|nr:DUF3017 domain-containing protein [Streptomyces sp. QL37]PPQ59282.1 hypothetical protein C5F59_23410 [Streptomyces sp. QL37]